MEKMIKKKIVIKGKKVKDVTYRPFLLNVADTELIPYFDARNKKETDEDGNEIVEVFVGGDSSQVDRFIEFVKDFENNKPDDAVVGSVEVIYDDYKGSIRTTESFSRWLSNDQLYKVVKIGTVMLKKQDQMLGKQDETIQEIKNIREDLKPIPYIDIRTKEVEKDVSQIRKKMKML